MRCVVSRRCSTQGHRPTLDVRLTRRNQLYSAATARRIHLADLAHDGVRHARRLDRLDRGVRVRRDATIQTIDRKSTRLNSSHVAISYAVFCLKKKKNK